MTKQDQIISLASTKGVIRPSDADKIGVSVRVLDDLVEQGFLNKVARGTYTSPDYKITENHDLAVVCAYIPRCTICLLSALQFHGIGTQMPTSIWIALPNFTRQPKGVSLPLEVIRMKASSLDKGVEIHTIEGVSIRVFSPAKTVADCFKYSSAIGLDVSLEALRDALARKLVTRDDLYKFAQSNRAWNVMRPYMEVI